MSWNEYLSNLQAKGLKHAAIATLAGDWSISSEGSNITQEEVKKAVNNMGKTDILAASGIHLGGIKYMFLSGDAESCRGKKGTSGVHCAKSNTMWVFGIYDDPTVPGQAAVGVESVTDHLKKSNL